MSVIIRLQNLPLTASSIDIRNFFHGLSIPDGGVHIVGGPEGDAFIAFSTDEDARQAMRLTGQPLKGSAVSLLLSSRNEMYKVIEQARLGPPMPTGPGQQHHQSSASASLMGSGGASSPPSHHHPHLSSHVSSSTSHLHHGYNQSGSNSVSSSMSPTSSGSSTNDYLRSLTGGALGGGIGPGGAPPQADLSTNPALLFSTMSAIPSATLGGANNAYLAQQHQQQQGQQSYPGLHSSPSSQQQQQQAQNSNPGGLQFGGGNNPAAAVSAFANGNPFLVPPPSLANMNLPFPASLLSAGAAAAVAQAQQQSNPLSGLTTTPTSANVLGLSSNVMNTTMSMAGQQSGTPNMNPFANPPPRMSLMSNGGMGGQASSIPQGGATQVGGHPGGPRLANFGNAGIHSNTYGAGVGATNHLGGGGPMGMGNRPQQHNMGGGPRPPFGNMGNNSMNKDRGFQLGAIPSGRAEMLNNNNNNRDNNNRAERQRSRSRSRERREGLARRRRSRSRERDRGANNNERRRRRSRSNSRSRSRDRAGKPSRRDSRDKRADPERRSRSDSSPDKSSQDSADPRGGGRSKREHEPSPTPNSTNTTTEEWPGAKLTGIPSDASYREIKEFIRAEVMGGSDGVVRLYDEGVAFLKLQNASEFPRVYKSNGRKLRGSAITIEGITMEIWTQEYKLNKSRIERDIDREKEERDREMAAANSGRGGRGGISGGSDRDKDHHHNRSERHNNHHNSSDTSSTTHHRSSRFSSASHQSSCIAIRGLNPTITKHELCTRYLQDTPCHDIVLIAAPTPTNRHSVTAFIQFESAHVAQGIIDSIARSPLGTTLVVESCDVDDLQKAKVRTSGGPLGLGGVIGGRGGPPAPGGIPQDAKSIFELDLGLDDETTTVIMKGAPPNIAERDVFDFFSDIGLAPMNVRILYDTDGQCSGQVICEFPDNNKAKRATTKDGMLFGRGHISVSLLPSRNINRGGGGGGGGNAGEFGQSHNFLRNPRPGLLGPPPPGGRGGQPQGPPGPGGMPRFPNPTSSPNIFEQALQQQSGPVRPGMGGRGSRGPNPSGGSERMSRFSGNNNNGRNDFRNQNGMGRGRPPLNKKEDPQLHIPDDDMALFNKKGCVIGLENIPYKASMDDILIYLEENLKIRIAPDRIIRRYDDMQKPTGDARVAFDTEFEAKLACDRLSGTYMWKRPISAAVIE